MPEENDIPISSFPDASAIGTGDKVTGLQSGGNVNFTFSGILAWLANAFTSIFVPVSRKINNKPLSADVTLNASDVSAQPSITTIGILKGNGAGNVSAAVPGTDYQAPLTAGTDYATPDMIPTTAAAVGALPADGTAVSAETLAVSHRISGGEGWYKFFEETVGTGLSRNYIFLITDTYSRQDGILSVFVNRNTQGATTVVVKVLAGTILPGSVRWEYSTSLVLYIQKTTSQGGYIQFRVMTNTARTGNPVDLTTRWKNEAVSEPTGATSATADVLRFTAQVVTVGTAQQIISISDAAITADHALAQIEFDDPEYIPTGYAWATADGSFTLTGTATASTTANILLIRKGN